MDEIKGRVIDSVVGVSNNNLRLIFKKLLIVTYFSFVAVKNESFTTGLFFKEMTAGNFLRSFGENSAKESTFISFILL